MPDWRLPVQLNALADAVPMMRHSNTARKRAPISNTVRDVAGDRDLYSGLMRLYILHHTAAEAAFGLGVFEELADRAYRISPGELYRILHARPLRKFYRGTPPGRKAPAAAKGKIAELFRDDITEGD